MIRKAVFSLWTKPYHYGERNSFGWASPEYFRAGFALAFAYARKNFARVEFFTDNEGAAIARQIGLDFDLVSTALESLAAPLSIWCAGKLKTYQLQKDPFLHIDNDVYLSQPLSQSALCTGILAEQNESNHFEDWYAPTIIKYSRTRGFVFPYNIDRSSSSTYCCGIFGGCDVSFIHEYASTAIGMIEKNGSFFSSLLPDGKACTMAEQWILGAMAAKKNKEVITLIDENDPQADAIEKGYRHFSASYKRDEALCENVMIHLRQAFPSVYEKAFSKNPINATT